MKSTTVLPALERSALRRASLSPPLQRRGQWGRSILCFVLLSLGGGELLRAQNPTDWKARILAGEAALVLREIEAQGISGPLDYETLLVGAEAALTLRKPGTARSLAARAQSLAPAGDGRGALMQGHALALQASRDLEGGGGGFLGIAMATESARAFERAREAGADAWEASWFAAESWLLAGEHRRALEAVEAARAAKAGDAGTELFRGRILLSLFELERATELAEAACAAAKQALSLDPSLGAAAALQLQALVALGDREAVRALFLRFVQETPNAVPLFQIVQEAYGKDRPLSFLTALYGDAKALIPEEERRTAHWFAAVTARADGDFATAESEARSYVQAAPNDPSGHFYLGLSLFKRGQYEAARDAYREALGLGFDEAEIIRAQRFVVLGFAQSQEFSLAASLQAELLARSQSFEDRADLAVLTVNAGGHEEGLALYRSLVTQPEVPAALRAKTWNNLGLALLGLGRREEARQAFTECIALLPEGADAYENRGIAALELSDKSAAAKDFERALEIEPKRLRSQYMLLLCRDPAGLVSRPSSP